MGCATSRDVRRHAKVEALDAATPPGMSRRRRQAAMSVGAARLLSLAPGSGPEDDGRAKLAQLDSFDRRLQNWEAWREVCGLLWEDTRPGSRAASVGPASRARPASLEVTMISVKDLMRGLEDDESPSLKFSPRSLSIPGRSLLFGKHMPPSYTTLDVNREFRRSRSGLGKGNDSVNGLQADLDMPGNESVYLCAAIQSMDLEDSPNLGKSSRLEGQTLADDVQSSGTYDSSDDASFQPSVLQPADAEPESPNIETTCACSQELSAEHRCPLFDPDLLALYERALKDWNLITDNEETLSTSIEVNLEDSTLKTNIKRLDLLTEKNGHFVEFSFSPTVNIGEKHNESQDLMGGSFIMDERNGPMQPEFLIELKHLLENYLSAPESSIDSNEIVDIHKEL